MMELDTHPGPLLPVASGIGAVTLEGLLTVQRTKLTVQRTKLTVQRTKKFPDHEALIGGCP